MASYKVSRETLKPGSLRYTIAVPEDHKPSKSTQLVLGLHYAGHQDNPYYGAGFLDTLLLPGLSQTGAILLAPDCVERDWLVPQSAKNVFAVLDYVEQLYQIEPGNTLLAGYSMGGIGTWHFAAEYPHRFRGAIPVATAPPRNILDRVWEIPLYVIHSHRDELFDLERTETAVEQLQESGVPIHLEVIESFTHYEVGRYAPFLKPAVDWIEAHAL